MTAAPLIPTSLDGWTIVHVETLLAQGADETDTFDFKGQLPHEKDKAGKLRLRKECCAFANSEGGFLIFGVADDRTRPPADRLTGLDPTFEFPRHFGEYPQLCNPSVQWVSAPLRIADGNDRRLHIVHIPRSWRGPHIVRDDEKPDLWHISKRTNKGIEPMSYEEVRMAFTGGYERRRKLGLLIRELEEFKSQAPSFLLSEAAPTALTHDAGELSLFTFELVIGDAYLILADHPGLLHDLGIVRRLVIKINHATRRYFEQQTRLAIGRHSPYSLNQHNQYVQLWSNQLSMDIPQCIEQLRRLIAE